MTLTDRIFAAMVDHQGLFLLAVAVLLLALTEFGFRLGLRLHKRKDEARRSQIGAIQGAILGLLALLLGFTFAMAANRYEERRLVVLHEANAIKTSHLSRISMTPGAV